MFTYIYVFFFFFFNRTEVGDLLWEASGKEMLKYMNERRLNLFSKFMFMCVCKETLHIHPTNRNKPFQKIQDKKKLST